MALNRLGVTTETRARNVAIMAALVLIGVALLCFLFSDIRLAMGAKGDSAFSQPPEQDKSDLRSRWSTTKINQVLAAIKMPGTPLPVESVPSEILNKLPLELLGRAYGIWNIAEFFKWAREHHFPLAYPDLRGIPLTGPDCKLEKADLRNTDLEYADLSKCDLTNADLTGAILRDANLFGAILRNAKLDHALLVGKANLSEAHIEGASLRQALLYGSTLVQANFTDADLEGAQFVDFAGTRFHMAVTALIGSGEIAQMPLSSPANLSKANLFGANLSGAIVGNANLEGASLYDAKFENTLIDVTQLEKAFNYRYMKPGTSSSRINIPADDLQSVEAFHREANRFFASKGMGEMAAEYHFWEQEAITHKPETPVPTRILRIALIKWPYGYGSRPMWLFYYSLSAVLIFAMFYVLLTINPKKSGIYRVYRENGEEKMIMLSWRKGLLLADCLYFSMLSFATFGYGIFQPRHWIEFFRFEPVQLQPVGWARILVGLEAAVGIYLLALLTTVLFGKA